MKRPPKWPRNSRYIYFVKYIYIVMIAVRPLHQVVFKFPAGFRLYTFVVTNELPHGHA